MTYNVFGGTLNLAQLNLEYEKSGSTFVIITPENLDGF